MRAACRHTTRLHPSCTTNTRIATSKRSTHSHKRLTTSVRKSRAKKRTFRQATNSTDRSACAWLMLPCLSFVFVLYMYFSTYWSALLYCYLPLCYFSLSFRTKHTLSLFLFSFARSVVRLLMYQIASKETIVMKKLGKVKNDQIGRVEKLEKAALTNERRVSTRMASIYSF